MLVTELLNNVYGQFVQINLIVPVLRHSAGTVSPASYHRSPGSIECQSFWGLQWTKWHSERDFLEFLLFPLSLSFNLISMIIVQLFLTLYIYICVYIFTNIWNMALYGAETWMLLAADQKYLGSFEM